MFLIQRIKIVIQHGYKMILSLGARLFWADEVRWCLHWVYRYQNGATPHIGVFIMAQLRHLPGGFFPPILAWSNGFHLRLHILRLARLVGWLDAERPWMPWCLGDNPFFFLSFLGIWRTYFVFSGFCCSIFAGVNAYWQISSKFLIY